MTKPTVQLFNDDCRNALKALPDASVDSVVTDPPYELGFMGKGWDASGIAYDVAMWREVLRVLKPGGHVLAFSGTRTYHRMAVAIEDAGFEIRDSIHWIYGSGFPKSLNVGKAIDKAAGAVRTTVIGQGKAGAAFHYGNPGEGGFGQTADKRGGVPSSSWDITAPATDAAKAWEGWGTTLKPAHEPVVVARKPLIGTVAENVQTRGTGALNINRCRVGAVGGTRKSGPPSMRPGNSLAGSVSGVFNGGGCEPIDAGRWPPNVLLSHAPDCDKTCAEDCAVAEMNRQGDGVSQFFPVFKYQAKASRSERGTDNKHPTVKPVALMRWLVRLVTPPGGVVLEPFMGSGTTGVACVQEGFAFIGVEREPQYFEICKARIDSAHHDQPMQSELFA